MNRSKSWYSVSKNVNILSNYLLACLCRAKILLTTAAFVGRHSAPPGKDIRGNRSAGGYPFGCRWAMPSCLEISGLLLAMLGIAGGARGSEFASMQTAIAVRNEAKTVGITPHPGAQLPLDMVFTNSHGRQVRLGEYFRPGRPVILAFVYYQCYGVCPYLQTGLLHAMEKLSAKPGQDYEVITISFSHRDTWQNAAHEKAEQITDATALFKQAIDEHWHFLVGGAKEDQRITSVVGFRYRWDPAINMYDHQAAIYVCTPTGKISNYFYGIHYHPADLKLALVQAGDQQISTVFDQILLFCCSFDPQTGKYTAVAYRVMSLAGVGVVLGLAGMFGALFYWEHKHRRMAPPVG
jgi:protein SCO1/2